MVSGQQVLVDEEDYPAVSQHEWHIDPGNGHVARTPKKRERPWEKLEDRRRVYLHREVMDNPERLHIIHLNRDPLDCRKANLRAANNQQRRFADGPQSRGASKYKGVSPSEGKWRVRLSTPIGRINIGLFEDEETAARIYDENASMYQGEFAYLNFTQGGD